MKRLNIRIPQDRGTLYDLIRYPAGETQVRLTQKCIDLLPGKDEYEIVTDRVFNIVELAQLKDALEHSRFMKDGGEFWSKSLFMHYLPYARADRRFVPGDTLGLRVFGDIINSLGFTTVWTFDVHSAASEAAIKGLCNIKPTNESSFDQITPVIQAIGPEDLVLIAPDSGAKARYDLDSYGLPVFIGEKKRDKASGALSGFGIQLDSINETTAFVAAKSGLIIDDICDGGGTFIGLAEAIKKINPDIELYLYVSHGIFSKSLFPLKLVFKEMYISDFSFVGPETQPEQLVNVE